MAETRKNEIKTTYSKKEMRWLIFNSVKLEEYISIGYLLFHERTLYNEDWYFRTCIIFNKKANQVRENYERKN